MTEVGVRQGMERPKIEDFKVNTTIQTVKGPQPFLHICTLRNQNLLENEHDSEKKFLWNLGTPRKS